jgi:hypothetical protein
MKKLLLTVFTFCIFNFTFAVQTNLLTFDTRDHGQIAQPNIRVTLSLLSPNPRTYEGQFIRQQPIAKLTDASGIGYFTNILWGTYRADIAGSPGTSYILYVGTNTLGTVNAASLVTNSAAVPPNDATLYYSKAQVDALIAGIESGSGTTYTNNSTGLPGVIVGSGIGTNIHAFGALTNNETRNVNFEGNVYLGGVATPAIELNASSGEGVFDGEVTAIAFSGEGASLTALNGSSISSGTVADSRIASTITRNSELQSSTNLIVSGLAAGSYSVKIPTTHGITVRAEYVNDGQFVGPNIYAGHPQNYIAPDEPGCFIAGGITNTTSGAAYTNTILDRISTIAGGVGNWIGQNSEGSFIGAGEQNKIMDDCTHSVIVGGEINTIEGLAEWSGILSGHHVAVGLGAGYSVMLGGDSNTNNGAYSTMGGGEFNRNDGLHAVVMGGQSNVASGAYSQVVGGYLNAQNGHASSIVGNRITNTLNHATVIGFHTNVLTVQSNGTVSTTGTYVGDGSGITNLLTSYTIQAGGTVATLPDSTAILNFGTTDPSMTITAAGTYMLQAGATLQYNAWEPDINPSTVTIKVRRTSGSPDDVSGANVNFDLATTGAAYTGPLMVVTTPMVIYTSAGSETIQLWGDRGGDPVGGSIEARSAWITAIRIR